MPSDVHARRLLVALVIAAVALTVVIIQPFWVALFLAAVLAATFRGWMEWLAARLGGRRGAAAAIVTAGVLVALVAPLAGLGAALVREALGGVAWVRQAIASSGVEGLLAKLPGPLQDLTRRAVEALPSWQSQLERIAGAGGQAAAAVGGLLAATGTVVLQTVLMLIAFFFFLTDGARLVAWIDAHVPLGPGQFRALLDEFRRTSVSVLVATLATAGIQSTAAFVGYLIARTPNPFFLALVTFVVALIPAAGATVAVVAIAALQLASGHLASGLFLIAWGLAVVALIDNLARPFLLKGGMALHGGIIFFSLLGGLAVFGGVGLVVGPLVVTFLVTVLNMYQREFALEARDEEGAGAPTPPGDGGALERRPPAEPRPPP